MATLIQVGLEDVITPSAVEVRACKGFSNVELKKYHVGHFDPYFDPIFEVIVSDQIEFLSRSLR